MINSDLEFFVPKCHLLNNELVGIQVFGWRMGAHAWGKRLIYGVRANDTAFHLGSLRTVKKGLLRVIPTD